MSKDIKMMTLKKAIKKLTLNSVLCYDGTDFSWCYKLGVSDGSISIIDSRNKEVEFSVQDFMDKSKVWFILSKKEYQKRNKKLLRRLGKIK